MLTRLTAPASLPLDLAALKPMLRIDTDDEDAVLTAFLQAAVDYLDGKDGLLGRALLTQQWTLTLDYGWPSTVVIPLPPLQSVDSITYVDPDGITQTLDSAAYMVLTDREPGVISPAYDTDWPAVRCQKAAISITFTAGYGAAGTDMPKSLLHAIVLLTGHLFEQRDVVVVGSGATVNEVPMGVHALLANHRFYS